MLEEGCHSGDDQELGLELRGFGQRKKGTERPREGQGKGETETQGRRDPERGGQRPGVPHLGSERAFT